MAIGDYSFYAPLPLARNSFKQRKQSFSFTKYVKYMKTIYKIYKTSSLLITTPIFLA